jgi:Reverse transcriptase (RNA-dependent DNA polymerase).
MLGVKKTQLYNRLISDENIYMAIYSVESYINNIELLEDEDLSKLNTLKDKYNEENISDIINQVKINIDKLLKDSKFFMKVNVYFKPKKYESDNNEIEFRPIHITDIINHITIVSMLNLLIYEKKAVCSECNVDKECYKKEKYSKCNKIVLSSLSRLVPSNFFGNRVSVNPESLYKPWTKQYKEYTSRANELFAKYHLNQEYRYEVDLDIKNFFPSINPEMIFNYILDKLPVIFNESESKLIKIILIKLLFFKINEDYFSADSKKIYYKNTNIPDKGSCYALGVPQGLPQSYFFANICMIEISKKFNNIFKGKSLYYVDDSVIFTNSIDGSMKNFKDKLNELNAEIKTISVKYYENCDANSYIKIYNSSIYKFTKEVNYNIEVHNAGGKSTFSDIVNSKTGEMYLKSISRETSKTAFDLNTSYSDDEDIILKERVITLVDTIKKEILLVDDQKKQFIEKGDEISNKNIEHLESYRKKLVRYKKYFEYRKIILEYRENNDYKSVSDKLIGDLIKIKNLENGIQEFFKLYNENILGAILSFIIKNEKNCFDENLIGKINNHLNKYLWDLNCKLFEFENKETSYIYKAYQLHINKKQYYDEKYTKYTTLKKRVQNIIPSFYRTHSKSKNKYFENNVLNEIDSNFSIIKKIFSPNFCKIIALVDDNTNEIKRAILNAIFSYAFNIEIDDNFNFSKKENRMINYKELRILCYVRNRYFNLNNFINKMIQIGSEESQTKIDYNILEVLIRFKTFVKYPDQIDDLIQVHKYTCDVWRNGSKYLYFYTLHNQEHAVDLIKSSIEIVKAISFIQISQLDYYILFLACYLHDISMVTLPDLDKIQNDNIKTNKIYTDFINDMSMIEYYDSQQTKGILKKYYKELDAFYENEVRSNHAKDSGKEIRNRGDLNFIETCMKDIVAEVAESHGYDTVEVYKSKSIASNRLVSKKYMQIILRVADLLDMSGYRVSKPILNNNLNNMTEISSFHWLSHLITEGYQWNVEYHLKEDGELKTYLENKNIIERIILVIKVNMSQLSKEEPANCKNMKLMKESLSQCGFKIKCGEACDKKNCNFLCKWLTKKNKYLFDEFKALQTYLNDNVNNYFKSELYVKVDIEDKTGMTAQEFEIINNYINS